MVRVREVATMGVGWSSEEWGSVGHLKISRETIKLVRRPSVASLADFTMSPSLVTGKPKSRVQQCAPHLYVTSLPHPCHPVYPIRTLEYCFLSVKMECVDCMNE
jgi:hypothetical protein